MSYLQGPWPSPHCPSCPYLHFLPFSAHLGVSSHSFSSGYSGQASLRGTGQHTPALGCLYLCRLLFPLPDSLRPFFQVFSTVNFSLRRSSTTLELHSPVSCFVLFIELTARSAPDYYLFWVCPSFPEHQLHEGKDHHMFCFWLYT